MTVMSIVKKLECIVALLLASLALQRQAGAQVTIDSCMRMARENYPQIRQLNLIEEASH